MIKHNTRVNLTVAAALAILISACSTFGFNGFNIAFISGTPYAVSSA